MTDPRVLLDCAASHLEMAASYLRELGEALKPVGPEVGSGPNPYFGTGGGTIDPRNSEPYIVTYAGYTGEDLTTLAKSLKPDNSKHGP